VSGGEVAVPKNNAAAAAEAAVAAATARSLSATKRENALLEGKFKDLQDRLAIVSAKKQAYRTSAKQMDIRASDLEATSSDLAQRVDEMQAELRVILETRTQAEAQILAMRTAHLHEVRLLQKGIFARKDNKVKDRIDEVGDLLNKLTSAVLQRDQTAIARARLEQKTHQLKVENRSLLTEKTQQEEELKSLLEKLRNLADQNHQLSVPAKAAVRAGAGAREDAEEFDASVVGLEQRCKILNDQTLGLQSAVKELTSRNMDLMKTVLSGESQQREVEEDRDQFKRKAQEEDAQLASIMAEHEKLKSNIQRLEAGIDKREKEIRSNLRTEKDELERAKTDLNAKAAELQAAQSKSLDAKAARPQGVEQDPLNPQHMGLGDFPDAPMDGRGVTPATPDADLGSGLGATIPVHSYDEVSTPERDVTHEQQQPSIRPDGSEVVAEHAQFVKTGELLQLEIVRLPEDTASEGVLVLRAQEISTSEHFELVLDREIIDEIDPDDPWGEVFSVVGMDLGPPKALVVPPLVSRDRVLVHPLEIQLIISVYKYSASRYLIVGLNEEDARVVEKVLLEDDLTDEHMQTIEACQDDEQSLFEFFSSRLQVFDEPPESEKPGFRFEFQ
jgi:uncharacterized protein YdcH (DUF465 family)